MTNAGRGKANFDEFGEMMVDMKDYRLIYRTKGGFEYFLRPFSELKLCRNIFVKSVTRRNARVS